MKDFRSRKQKNRFMYSPLFIIIIFFILVILLKSVFSLYQKRSRAKIEEERINTYHEELVRTRETISKDIETLSSDEGIKEELRTKYNVGENGETIIHIVNSDM